MSLISPAQRGKEQEGVLKKKRSSIGNFEKGKREKKKRRNRKKNHNNKNSKNVTWGSQSQFTQLEQSKIKRILIILE